MRHLQITDPGEALQLWKARYDAATSAFFARDISEHVFKAQLYSLGFRGREIESEVNLHWPKV